MRIPEFEAGVSTIPPQRQSGAPRIRTSINRVGAGRGPSYTSTPSHHTKDSNLEYLVQSQACCRYTSVVSRARHRPRTGNPLFTRQAHVHLCLTGAASGGVEPPSLGFQPSVRSAGPQCRSRSRTRTYDLVVNSHPLLPTELSESSAREIRTLTNLVLSQVSLPIGLERRASPGT